MQELRSTEILDKEIRAEAQRKADKILKNADAECEKILSSVDERVAEAKKEKELFYEKKLSILENDQAASIPLEKQRFEVSFIQDSLAKQMNEYLASLSEEKRIDLILNQFNLELLKDKKLNAFVYGFDLGFAKKVLDKKFGSNLLKCEKTEFGKIVTEEDCSLENKAGIILESEDKLYRCRLSLSEVVNNLFNKYRAELSDALFN